MPADALGVQEPLNQGFLLMEGRAAWRGTTRARIGTGARWTCIPANILGFRVPAEGGTRRLAQVLPERGPARARDGHVPARAHHLPAPAQDAGRAAQGGEPPSATRRAGTACGVSPEELIGEGILISGKARAPLNHKP